MVKVDWDQGSSWNLGLGCCDPIFDLAGVTAASQDATFARDLRCAYEALVGEPIDEERWVLYQLAHLSARPDARREGRHALRRACARAVQNYFRRVYLDDLVLDDEGPLCGIDIDGVLETEYLGFPALTPASAGGLRALLAHGYRPLIATGRSLGDVIERCEAYRLAGGVAEYGSATYESRDELVTVLTCSDEQGAIERLRSELRVTDGVVLDEDYTHAMRAFVFDGRGVRGPLPQQMIADAQRAAAAEQISLIVGDRQTDVIAGSVDKGRGMRSLASALAADDVRGADAPLAFAVGDTAADVSLLMLAKRPFAPAHAKHSLGARFTVTRRPYQRGFAEAVGHLIGHAPGTCPLCRLGTTSRERRLLLELFGLRESGVGGLPSRVLKLAASISSPERPS
jgi:hydroxymethylpyrimidine pyrophosphatase-like HAD family hydrolase